MGPTIPNKASGLQIEMDWTSHARQEASCVLCIDAIDTCGIFVIGQDRQMVDFATRI